MRLNSQSVCALPQDTVAIGLEHGHRKPRRGDASQVRPHLPRWHFPDFGFNAFGWLNIMRRRHYKAVSGPQACFLCPQIAELPGLETVIRFTHVVAELAHRIFNHVRRTAPGGRLLTGAEQLQRIAKEVIAFFSEVPCPADCNMGTRRKGKHNPDAPTDGFWRNPSAHIPPDVSNVSFGAVLSDTVLNVNAITLVSVQRPGADHVARSVTQGNHNGFICAFFDG